jgi:hypothetical protein
MDQSHDIPEYSGVLDERMRVGLVGGCRNCSS